MGGYSVQLVMMSLVPLGFLGYAAAVKSRGMIALAAVLSALVLLLAAALW